MVVAASPPPAPAPDAGADRPHPTYTKMITRALKDMGGSSARSAIADYILGSFSGLPDSHEALLSAHLRRLVAEGVLHTDGADYTYGPPPQPAGEKLGPGLPRNDSSDASPAAPVPVAVPVVGEKRGRGRPRKIPAQATPSVLPAKRKQPAGSVLSGDDDSVAPIRAAAEAEEATTVQNNGGPMPSTGIKRGRGRPWGSKTKKRPRGRPRKEAQATPSVLPAKRKQSAGPVLSGDDDSVANTAPIRAAAEAEEATTFHNGGMKRGRGRPWGSKSKKRPRGRPRKEAASEAAGSVGASRGFKRGCGRPSMGRPVGMKTETRGMEESSSSAAAVKRGRGRPRKYPSHASASAAATSEPVGGTPRMESLAAAISPASTGFKRGRGRPPKKKVPDAAATSAETTQDAG